MKQFTNTYPATTESSYSCGYVLCKQHGFCTGKNLSPHLPLFPLQIVFDDKKQGRSAKFYPCTTILYIDLLENLSLVQGKLASMILLELHILQVWQVGEA